MKRNPEILVLAVSLLYINLIQVLFKRNLHIQLGIKKDSLSSRFGGVFASYKFKYLLKRNLQIQLGIKKDLGNLVLEVALLLYQPGILVLEVALLGVVIPL